jgi:hypothetical protein
MPFVLFIAGLLLIVSVVRGKTDLLYTLIKNDFTGTNSFVPWIVSIFFIGALGYVPSIRPITNAFLVLVIIVLFLSNGGFFAKFIQQTGIGSGITAANIGNVPSLGKMPSINLSTLGF